MLPLFLSNTGYIYWIESLPPKETQSNHLEQHMWFYQTRKVNYTCLVEVKLNHITNILLVATPFYA